MTARTWRAQWRSGTDFNPHRRRARRLAGPAHGDAGDLTARPTSDGLRDLDRGAASPVQSAQSLAPLSRRRTARSSARRASNLGVWKCCWSARRTPARTVWSMRSGCCFTEIWRCRSSSIDSGTATTFDVVSRRGGLCGRHHRPGHQPVHAGACTPPPPSCRASPSGKPENDHRDAIPSRPCRPASSGAMSS